MIAAERPFPLPLGEGRVRVFSATGEDWAALAANLISITGIQKPNHHGLVT